MVDNITWNSWRDKLLDASFRGVPFFIESHSAEGGRRSVLHQFPYNDTPYWEDLGKDAGLYHVVAYVCANATNRYDYFYDRNLLKWALEAPGPGTLIHPFLGELWVGVQGKYKLDESFKEGGIARFTIIFADAGMPQQPASYTDIESEATQTGDNTQTSIWGEISAKLSLVNQIGFVVQDAVQQATSFVNSIQNALLIPNAVLGSAISAAVTLAATIRTTIATAQALPATLASTLQGASQIFTQLQPSLPAKNNSLVLAALSLTDFNNNAVAIQATTPDRVLQQANRNLLTDAMHCFGLTEAVRAAALMDFASTDDVAAMRDQLTAAFDDVMLGIGARSQNDALYAAMADLFPFMVQTMSAKGANLPTVRDVVLPADPMPSIVMASAYYDDLGREQEIIDMNPGVMRHPGFPLGGQTLKVLSS